MWRAIKTSLVAALALTLVVPAVLLALGVLPYRVFIVHTGSMSPTIPSMSVVIDKPEYHLGQPITFRHNGAVITHRLVAEDADGLVTKGDANATVDPFKTKPSDVVGGVVLAPRYIGYWILYFQNMRNLAALVLCAVCIWLMASITKDLLRRPGTPTTENPTEVEATTGPVALA